MVGRIFSARTLGFFTVVTTLGVMGSARADISIDFEGHEHLTLITDQYLAQGIRFSGGATIYNAPLYDSYVLSPPRSGIGVLAAPDTGFIRVDAVGSLWQSVSAWGTVGGVLNLSAFDVDGNLLGTNTIGTIERAKALMTVSAPNIAYATISDGGSYFTIDDLSFSSKSPDPPLPTVPAPGAALLVALGLAILRGLRHRIL